MKIKFLSILGLASSLFFFSCADNGTETDETTDSTSVDSASVAYSIDTEASVINWAGNTAGVTVYGHSGTIKIKEGSLEVSGDKITGGSFVIDMTTITPTDSNYAYDEKSNPTNLKGHLTQGDFFLVDSFPTAKFVITGVAEGKVMGDMTIRDKTNAETITITSWEPTETGYKAVASLTFDRQKYGVAWAHFLKDTVLSDEIPLTIELVVTK